MAEQASNVTETRYAFELCEVRKRDDGYPEYVTIRQIEVDPTVLGFGALQTGLRGWAREVVASERHEVGLFYAVFCTLDEDDMPERCVSQLYFAWDGSKEMSLAG